MRDRKGLPLILALIAAIPVLAQSSIFSLEEKSAKGKSTNRFPPEASQPVVDINSTVQIKIDRDAMTALLRGPVNTRLVQRMQQLKDLQIRANDAMRKVLTFEQRVALLTPAERSSLASQNWGKPGEDFVAAQDALEGLNRKFTDYLKEAYPDTWQGLNDDLATYQKKRPHFLSHEVEAIGKALISKDGYPAASLELTARLSPGGFIHLPGYDTLAPGDPVLYQKNQFVFGPEFQAGTEAAENLAKAIQEGHGLQEMLKLKFKGQFDQVKAVTVMLDTAINSIQKELEKDWKPLAKDLQEVSNKWKDFQEAIKGAQAGWPDDSKSPGDSLQLLVSAFQGVVTKGDAVVAALKTLKDDADKARLAFPSDLASAKDELKSVLDLLGKLGVTSNASIGDLPQALFVPVNQVRETEINLVMTPRKDGELLAIRARLIREGAAPGDLPIFEQTRLLEVRVTEWSTDVGGVLHFVRVTGDPRNSYVPAPGAYAVFRYRGKRAENAAGTGFFGVVAPGIGLATVGVPMQDGSTKLGVMGTAHLFGDILQVSYGRTTSNDRLFSVGIGLQRMFGFGKTY